MADKNTEGLLADYVGSQENADLGVDAARISETRNDRQAGPHDDMLGNMPAPGLREARAARLAEGAANAQALGLGWNQIQIENLPTQGLFYPEGTRIYIRAASSAEIRHWSTISDDDITAFDDAVNYVIERCARIKFPDEYNQIATWRDFKEVDRLFILLAIRDYTFTEGNNDLTINVSEGKQIKVHNSDIQIVNFDDKLMKHYNPDARCFTFQLPKSSKKLNVYLPSIGVSQWIKNYIIRRQRSQEGFDEDFVTLAPILIKDYRQLTESSYENFVQQSYNYSTYEYSILAKSRELIQASITPLVKYVDEAGGEQTAPLNFRGGAKSIFLYNLEDVF